MSLLDGHPLTMLARVEKPSDVAGLTNEELAHLAQDVRELIIATVSENGGHLAPSLGVVELTLAMLKVFDLSRDKVVWDVGHQAYAYKILAGRRDCFHTLRTMGGISGFPRMAESPYDHFGTGHSSTSISAASGMAMARDVLGASNKVLAVIGDGSMTAGLAYEGLNQAGGDGRDLVVVLNDNKMSISKNVGALSLFLSRKLSNRWVTRAKKEFESVAKLMPFGQEMVDLVKRGEESFKGFFTPGMLFEAFHFNYVGPIDGHDLPKLISVFKEVREMKGPVLVHVLTQKGKGYTPAEENPTYYHGVGSFEPETGEIIKYSASKLPTYTDVFGDTLCKLAAKDKRIVAITAAMPEGTGLACYSNLYPDRFVDVGICEQHAVTFAAGLATQGLKPVVAIYSTFLQRSYDQIVHDVCLQNLPVTLCLDRGGLVGEDGATHHGVFDISFLRHIPNLVLMAPKDEAELQRMLATAMAHPGPVAIRYLRGVGIGADLADEPAPLPVGQGELLRDGSDAVIVALGSRVLPALQAAMELEAVSGLSVAVYNARFVKPLPEDDLAALAGRFGAMVTVEENALQGGFGSAVLECLAERGALSGLKFKRLGIPDHFVEHGPQKALREMLGIHKDGIKAAVLELAGGGK
ncbi:MAG: 1-deoxy-D-xylulose-5-phosphate synthase [Thermodesulfobacteriota bacterium]